MDLATFRSKVERLIKDGGAVLDVDDLDFAIGEAVRRYSRVKPLKVVADIAGSGAFDYDLPEPFDPQFSVLELVEYPAGEREPVYVDPLDRTLYESPAGTKLRFLADAPPVGATIRVTFSAMHTVTGTATSIPSVHFDVIHLIGASLACEALASHYSNVGDSTLRADSVDHKSKASEYAQRAKRFMSMADQLLPISEQGKPRAASAQDTLAEDRPWLTHPTR